MNKKAPLEQLFPEWSVKFIGACKAEKVQQRLQDLRKKQQIELREERYDFNS
jgi:hypothetical protein